MDTRGWMGGVSRRAILSIKPETFFRAAFETSLKISRSLACKCVKGMTRVEGLSRQKLDYEGLLDSLYICLRALSSVRVEDGPSLPGAERSKDPHLRHTLPALAAGPGSL